MSTKTSQLEEVTPPCSKGRMSDVTALLEPIVLDDSKRITWDTGGWDMRKEMEQVQESWIGKNCHCSEQCNWQRIAKKPMKILRELYCQRNEETGLKKKKKEKEQWLGIQTWTSKKPTEKVIQLPKRTYFPTPILDVAMESNGQLPEGGRGYGEQRTKKFFRDSNTRF